MPRSVLYKTATADAKIQNFRDYYNYYAGDLADYKEAQRFFRTGWRQRQFASIDNQDTEQYFLHSKQDYALLDLIAKQRTLAQTDAAAAQAMEMQIQRAAWDSLTAHGQSKSRTGPYSIYETFAAEDAARLSLLERAEQGWENLVERLKPLRSEHDAGTPERKSGFFSRKAVRTVMAGLVLTAAVTGFAFRRKIFGNLFGKQETAAAVAGIPPQAVDTSLQNFSRTDSADKAKTLLAQKQWQQDSLAAAAARNALQDDTSQAVSTVSHQPVAVARPKKPVVSPAYAAALPEDKATAPDDSQPDQQAQTAEDISAALSATYQAGIREADSTAALTADLAGTETLLASSTTRNDTLAALPVVQAKPRPVAKKTARFIRNVVAATTPPAARPEAPVKKAVAKPAAAVPPQPAMATATPIIYQPKDLADAIDSLNAHDTSSATHATLVVAQNDWLDFKDLQARHDELRKEKDALQNKAKGVYMNNRRVESLVKNLNMVARLERAKIAAGMAHIYGDTLPVNTASENPARAFPENRDDINLTRPASKPAPVDSMRQRAFAPSAFGR